MIKKPFFVVLSTAVLSAILLSACKKENKPVTDRPLSATQVIPANPVLAGILGTGHNIKDTILLTSTITWHLSGLVYVDSSDVLIIQPGTVIKGDISSASNFPGGGLIITRGAKILAWGTSSAPIIFTSASVTPVSGDWSGVIILGNATTNHTGRVPVEGIPSTIVPNIDVTYGGSAGTNNLDNSGILQYVRIEYAGYELSPNNKINGLTLGGVGSNTIIDNVEVFKANDDAFQFFGGTVNASHLIAIDALDELFETVNGYTGTISYALGLTDSTRADNSTSNAIESDNNNEGNSATPLTNPTYNYITIVGLRTQARASITNGSPSGVGRYGRAAYLRRNTRCSINNSIFLGYNYGLSQDNATGTFTNNYVQAFIYPFLTEVNGATRTPILTPTGNAAYISADPNLNTSLINPFNRFFISNFMVDSQADDSEAGAFASGNWAFSGTWVRLHQ